MKRIRAAAYETMADVTLPAQSVARFAGLLADRTRAAMCLALLDGRAWTAGELAQHAGVGRSTATEHLNILVGGGLLAEERQGRHRYVRLANPWVAQLVEDLAAAVGEPGRPRSLRAVRPPTSSRRPVPATTIWPARWGSGCTTGWWPPG